MKKICWPLFLLSILVLSVEGRPPSFSSEKASFFVRYHGHDSSYRISPAFCLPNEEIQLELLGSKPYEKFHIRIATNTTIIPSGHRWIWQVPSKPGLYPVEIRQESDWDVIRLHLFVLTPKEEIKRGQLNGYRIGRYPPKIKRRQLPVDEPLGYIQVTQKNWRTYISPHFQLGQFASEQKTDFQHYIYVDEKLILKLERILQVVNQRGFYTPTLRILAGYQTPHYARRVGTLGTKLHIWGMGAQIIVDEKPRDDRMDDLNRNGQLDSGDGEVLFQMVEDLESVPQFSPYVGALGLQRSSRRHGSTIYTDIRGVKTRWKR